MRVHAEGERPPSRPARVREQGIVTRGATPLRTFKATRLRRFANDGFFIGKIVVPNHGKPCVLAPDGT